MNDCIKREDDDYLSNFCDPTKLNDYIKRRDAFIILEGTWVDGTEYMGYLFDDFENIHAADVVEVVRCKDCKWWDNDGDAERCTHKYGGMWAKSDGYCSYGERAEA